MPKVQIRARFADKAAAPTTLKSPIPSTPDVRKLDIRQRHELLIEQARQLGFIHMGTKLHQESGYNPYTYDDGRPHRGVAFDHRTMAEMRFIISN